MHFAVMLGIPVFFYSPITRYKPFFDLREVFSPLHIALFLAVAVIGFLGFMPLRCEVMPEPLCIDLSAFALSLVQNLSLSVRVLVALYFVFVNPLVEEFFWRTFLWRELSLCATPPVRTNDLEAAAVYGSVGSPVTATEAASPRELETLCVWRSVGLSLAYALYHVVLVYWRVSVVAAAYALVGLTALGLVLVKVRESHGVSWAVVVHAGVDATAVVVMLYSLPTMKH